MSVRFLMWLSLFCLLLFACYMLRKIRAQLKEITSFLRDLYEPCQITIDPPSDQEIIRSVSSAGFNARDFDYPGEGSMPANQPD